MLLSEPMYCVAVTFKITEWVEQWICIKFYISLNIPLQKLLRWFRRPQLWSPGNWHLHPNNTPAYAPILFRVFWWNIKSLRWLRPPYSPDLVPCNFWLFPKLKSPLKGKRFQIINEIQEKTKEHLMETGSTAYFERDWGIIVVYTMFLVSLIFFNKRPYFSCCVAGYFLDRPHTTHQINKISLQLRKCRLPHRPGQWSPCPIV